MVLAVTLMTTFTTAPYAEETTQSNEESLDGSAVSDENAAAAEVQTEDGESEEVISEETETTGGYAASSEAAALIDDSEKVTTSHSAMINGRKTDYTATTGKMVISSCGGECSISYTAYTLDDVEDRAARPVTFAYNGGPGAGSACVDLLFIGPRTVELDEKGYSVELPAKLKDNEYSLLDLTDLVIINAVGTGYSRTADTTDSTLYYGYENDCSVTGDFIWLYLNNNGLWSSPKYLLGESYGTMRSMGVCEYLYDQYTLPLNGLIQVSSVHDLVIYQDMYMDDDTGFVRFLPTIAADAWYHGKVAEKYRNMDIADFVNEVRIFADTEYISALTRGDSLTEEELNAAAEKLSEYIGLDAEYIRSKNLRVNYVDFSTELLKDQNLIIGRMDGRVTGPSMLDMLGSSAGDPSFIDTMSVLGSVTNQYYNDELDLHSDIPFNQINYVINTSWTFPDDISRVFSQKDTIYYNICVNRHLKVWVLCGYYDLSTPFHFAEWTYNHLHLNEDNKSQVQFTYYEGGHMFYLNPDAHEQFHKDAEAWFNS